MKSAVIEGMLKEELARNERMIKRYQAELDSLPKGTIVKRIINTDEYYYLNYRENKKVISKYLGKADAFNLDDLEKQIKKRQDIIKILRKLKIEEKELKKILS